LTPRGVFFDEMKKQEKTFFVQNLTEELKNAKSAILVDFTGLSVKAQQLLKERLSEAGGRMLVVKNTLFKLAGKNAKIPKETLEDSVLTGPTAIVIAEDDPLAPIQAIASFAKEHEIPQFKVGIVEGVFQDKSTLIRLSKLPGKDILFAQAVGTISSPIQATLNVLQTNLQNLVFVLKEASKKTN